MPGADINIRIGADISQLRTELAAGTASVKNFTTQAGQIGPGMITAQKEVTALGTAARGSVEHLSKTSKAIEHLTNADDIAAHSIRGFGRELLHIGPALAFEGLAIGVSLLAAFVSELVSAADSTKNLSEQQRIYASLEEEANKSAGEEYASLVTLRGAIESTSVPMATRLQAIKDLKKEFPGLFDGLTNEQLLTGNVANAYDLAAAAILRKARASAAAKGIEEVAAKKFAILQKEEDDRLKSIQDAANAKPVSRKFTSYDTKDLTQDLSSSAQEEADLITKKYNIRKKGYDDELAQLEHQEKFLLQFAVEGADQTIKIEKKKGEGVKKALTESFNANFDKLKRHQEEKIRLLDDDVNNEKFTYSERLDAFRKWMAENQVLLNLEEAHDIAEARKKKDAAQHIKDIQDKSYIESSKLISAGDKKVEKLRNDHLKVVSEQDKQEIEYEDMANKALAKLKEEQIKGMAKFDADDLKRLQEHAKAVSDAVNSFSGSVAGAVMSGTSVIKAAMSSILGLFGDFLIKKGRILILKGIAANLVIPGSGVKDIIGGGLEIAAGSFAKAIKFATGTRSFGGTAIVGERGPELVTLPRGSGVTPNAQLNAMGNGGSNIVAEYTIRGTDLHTVLKRTNSMISLNG